MVCFTDDYTTCQHFLRALIKAPDETTPPCSGLRSLEFRYTIFGIDSIDRETIAVLEDVVRERRDSATPIKQILVAERDIDAWKIMFEFKDLLDVIGC
ncbi:hypothetical protein ONZ45_g5028 [Pleurotus djamor]|nr:hypothetical protein ONZ45_g5028 [Pleurotus djamor]